MQDKARNLVHRLATILLVLLASGWTVVNGRIALAHVRRPPTAAEPGFDSPRTGLTEGHTLYGGAPRLVDQAIHIFSDYECATCQGLFVQLERLYTSDGRRLVPVRVHNLPLRIHPKAMPMALMSVCASRQGRFAEAHAALFRAARGQSGAQPSEIAAAAGVVDVPAFESCLQSAAAAEEIAADKVAAASFGDPVTPIVVIGDSVYFGLPYDLKRLVKAASARP